MPTNRASHGSGRPESPASDDGELDQFKPGNHQSALGGSFRSWRKEKPTGKGMYVPAGLTVPVAGSPPSGGGWALPAPKAQTPK